MVATDGAGCSSCERAARDAEEHEAALRELTGALRAMRRGDLDVRVPRRAGVAGEAAEELSGFVAQQQRRSRELARVGRVVGREGRMAERMDEDADDGVWSRNSRAINCLIDDLVRPTSEIARVIEAVAEGDLTQHMAVELEHRPLRGEFRRIGRTVNTMVDQLSSFADEVTRVAREVGTEGKLGGQAQVTGVAGTWRDLTENVNQLASTLTTQLRAIAAVSTAVTRGDLTQQVRVNARGEVAELKDNINQMIVTLRETTGKNAAQVWLDSNLARMAGLLQGQRDPGAVCQLLMNEVAPLVNAHSGVFFLAEDRARDGGAVEVPTEAEPGPRWRRRGGYALDTSAAPESFGAGEGLIGQAGVTQQVVHVEGIPVDELVVRTGAHSLIPAAVVVLPVVFEGHTLGVIEFGSLTAFSELHLGFLERLAATIGVTLATIQANQRTEGLLGQAQRLAAELQDQSVELQRTNAELQDKASLLSEQNRNIELKNLEIDAARRGVEEQAEQLAQASRYKSEFLANMSHELRTPLNSMLLLSRLLADNPDGSLTDKQREFATTIHNAGNDLRVLIDDILDLSKIEAGRVQLEHQVTDLTAEGEELLLTFAPQADDKGLTFGVEMAEGVPARFVTDSHRLRQILRNLVSNALKFTATGGVTVTIEPAAPVDQDGGITGALGAVAFVVRDTGIGIPEHQQATIFEAFAQADGTTSRSYGGTGLGLSISRELAHMLGGTLAVTSAPGQGSTFTLLLPNHPAPTSISPPWTIRGPELAVVGAESPPPALRAEPSVSMAHVAGVEVLIVDDDVRNVFALTSALEVRGISVRYADNGHDAIRLVTDRPEIDIVLMDAMMPGLDGKETTRGIRELPRGRELPIVFLTAKAAPDDRDAALAAGATDYLTKPVDLDHLLATITRALE